MKLLGLLLFFYAAQVFPMSRLSANASRVMEDSILTRVGSAQDSLQTIDSSKSIFRAVADSSTLDSLNTKAAIDTIIPLTFHAENSFSSIIPQEEIRRMNLRYTGDLFALLPVSYKRSLGMSGLPEELNFYGAGFNNVSYFENGILLNDRTRNFYDLNLYQTEDVDSIEVVPSPRGFLNGVFNNLAAVNFITKDFVAMPPYTRIKYIESPLGEGYVDAQFNSLFSKKYLFSFDVSNRKVDAGFRNSGYSLWQAKVKLKYFYSNSLNIFFNYNFVKSDVGLNGGLNVDSIGSFTWQEGNELAAPVLISEHYQKVKQHNFSLRALAHFYEESTSELSFYYRFNLDEYRQNEFGQQSGIQTVISDRKTKVLGGIVSHQTNFSIFNLALKGNYEYVDYSGYYSYPTFINWNHSSHENNLILDGILTLNSPDNKLIPAVFSKFVSTKGNRYFSFGGDIDYLLSDNSSIYSGISYVEKTHDYDPLTTSILGESFNTLLISEIGYKAMTEKMSTILNLFYNRDGSWITYEESYGACITFNYQYWKIHALTNSLFTKKKSRYSSVEPFLPYVTLNWKIEYRDTLFNTSLLLRTGFEAKYSGRQVYSIYNFYETHVYYNSSKPEIPAWFTLDFYLSGEIQKSAMIYFSWENLLGNFYYVTPYFPMPTRGIRFGISWEFAN